MPQFAVDGKGNKIKTDILVTGYIREYGKEYSLLIPVDINTLCFQFWIIKICDEWDEEFSFKNIDIDGPIVKYKGNCDEALVYGCHSIDKGSYSWEIQMTRKTDEAWFFMGIIEDEPDILKKSSTDFDYLFDNACCLHDDGKLSRGRISSGKPYIPTNVLRSKKYKIQMTLDMDNHTLRYAVNGKDYGVATNELDKKRYRMVVTFFYEYSIKLL